MKKICAQTRSVAWELIMQLIQHWDTGRLWHVRHACITSGYRLGDRAFPVVAARAWNALPDYVTSAPTFAAA